MGYAFQWLKHLALTRVRALEDRCRCLGLMPNCSSAGWQKPRNVGASLILLDSYGGSYLISSGIGDTVWPGSTNRCTNGISSADFAAKLQGL